MAKRNGSSRPQAVSGTREVVRDQQGRFVPWPSSLWAARPCAMATIVVESTAITLSGDISDGAIATIIFVTAI
eukprot:1459992-Rhodomonas_salina.1